MTTRLAPGSPKLVMDGKEQTGDVLSDSDWEELDNTDPEDQTRANLVKIANARRKPTRGRSAKG